MITDSELITKATGKLNDETEKEITIKTPEEKEAEAILARNSVQDNR